MILTIVYFILPLAISSALIPAILNLAIDQQWFDQPGERKLHLKPIPALGGMAIYISFCYTLGLVSLENNTPNILFLLFPITLLFLVGLWDDLKGLSAKKRLAIQIFTAGICFSGGYAFVGDYGLFGWTTLPIGLQFLVTTFFIVLLINAYNLIDGINGLAGGLGVIVAFSFCYLFANAGMYFWSGCALAISGSLLGFLRYNFGQAKIFMGDNGSTFMGLIFALFFLQYINIPASPTVQSNHFILGCSLFAVPVLDLIRVSIIRMRAGRSPFHADQTHIHHLLLNCVNGHKPATLIILTLQVFLFALTHFLLHNTYGIITVFTLLILSYILFIKLIEISHALTSIKSMEAHRRQLGKLY